MKIIKGIIFFAIICCYTTLVANTFREVKGFMGMELNGYNHMNDDFSRVCENKDQFIIRKGITDAVASKREDSYIFTLSTFVLKHFMTIKKAHRVIAVVLLFISTLFFVLLLCKLKINFFLSLIALAYWLFSPQFLAYFFEFKLTMASITLTTVVFFVLCALDQSLKRFKNISFFYSFILPFLLINFGYDVFCISRPLNIFIFIFLFLYLLIYHKKQFLVFLVTSIVSLSIFKITNPDVKPNLGLFQARGESIVSREDQMSISRDAKENIKERVVELKNLLDKPKDWEYSSETVGHVGARDLILAFNIAFLIFFILFCFTDEKKYISKYIKDRDFFIPLLILSIIVTLVTPLAASSPIRGHRFSNFYFLLLILTTIIINRLLNKTNKVFFILINIGLLVAGAFYVKYKVLIYKNYNFNELITQKIEWFQDGIKKIEEETRDIESIENVTVCDTSQSEFFLVHPTWNGILYLTGVGCKSKNTPVVLEEEGLECPCPKGKNSLCIIKTSLRDVDVKYIE